jgi:hypothetical protein
MIDLCGMAMRAFRAMARSSKIAAKNKAITGQLRPSESKVMHRKRWIIVLATTITISAIATGATVSIFPCLALAGQAPTAPQETKPATSESSSTSKAKRSHANDLLIRGTVFNERGLSMQGVRLRIHRVDAKKPHWETYTNSRGEFAVRVPTGSDYQIAAEIKEFAKQSQAVHGKDGAAEEKVIFHMEPVKAGNTDKGGKP